MTTGNERAMSVPDAAATRSALVVAARRRFATDGYRATTVRRIAADAGVNVALINRYFVSKKGLFEACMIRTYDELDTRTSAPVSGREEAIERLVQHVVDAPNRKDSLQVLLLLRSSGDESAERIRLQTLERLTHRLAAVAGWREDSPETASVLLRAQIAISVLLGAVMIRTRVLAEPLASVTADELSVPLREIFRSLIDP